MRILSLIFIVAALSACTYNPPKPLSDAERSARDQRQSNRDNAQRAIDTYTRAYDGSCVPLVSYVKDKMYDPNSFEHLSTKYSIGSGYVFVSMEYIGTNGFGGRMRQTTIAHMSFDGRILSAQ
jgi:hypothetical protein